MDERKKIVLENGLEMAGTGFGANEDAILSLIHI